MAELLIIAHTKNNEVMMIKAPAEEAEAAHFKCMEYHWQWGVIVPLALLWRLCVPKQGEAKQ